MSNYELCNDFKKGFMDGLPIGLGYLSVSFAFGMMAVSMGVSIFDAILISMTNLTSAGQFAGLDIMMKQNAYIEMALTQIIINLRYSLMSLSLSQKIDPKMKTGERILISFAITDEIFAVASSQNGKVGKKYFFGLMILPIIGWTLGTALGAGATSLMPKMVQNCLSVALYGMFIAIIIPPSKKDKNIRKVIIMAAAFSCIFYFLKPYFSIGSGFVIIICTVLSAGIGAFLYPIKEDA
ncbi:MAG: AzlC family ABC transporter permease [Holdemanella sp.]|nr:AzlC family ABC transporter permease [Holdemanella sp.]